MDKHRKAVIELCSRIELASASAHEDQKVMLDNRDWAGLKKLVSEIKASFNHNTQYRYEQHLERERELRSSREG